MSEYKYPRGKKVGEIRCQSCGHTNPLLVSHYKNGECGVYYACTHEDEEGGRCKGRNYLGPAFARRTFAKYEAAKAATHVEAKPQSDAEKEAPRDEQEDDFLNW